MIREHPVDELLLVVTPDINRELDQLGVAVVVRNIQIVIL